MLKVLAVLEEQFQRWIERPLMRLFGGQLVPADIAKHLSRVMEDERQVFAGKLIGPNYYEVHLASEDLDGFRSYEDTLVQDLADYLIDLAQRRGITLLGRPQIELIATPGLSKGDIEVSGQLKDMNADGNTRQFTQPFEQVAVEERPQEVAATAWLELPDRTVALDRPFMRMGRSTDNDIILEADDVSRNHAEIKLRGGRYVLTDLNSANGTRVNGERVTGEVVLQPNDEVCLAASCMTFKTSGWR